jgi:hypothetical protein
MSGAPSKEAAELWLRMRWAEEVTSKKEKTLRCCLTAFVTAATTLRVSTNLARFRPHPTTSTPRHRTKFSIEQKIISSNKTIRKKNFETFHCGARIPLMAALAREPRRFRAQKPRKSLILLLFRACHSHFHHPI